MDWGIVALDAIGLMLFFVPGVIAFAVDFNNGTIYLPPTQSPQKTAEEPPLVSVQAPDAALTPKKLEEVVSEHTDRGILLPPGEYQTEQLQNINDFWPTARKHGKKLQAV